MSAAPASSRDEQIHWCCYFVRNKQTELNSTQALWFISARQQYFGDLKTFILKQTKRQFCCFLYSAEKHNTYIYSNKNLCQGYTQQLLQWLLSVCIIWNWNRIVWFGLLDVVAVQIFTKLYFVGGDLFVMNVWGYKQLTCPVSPMCLQEEREPQFHYSMENIS